MMQRLGATYTAGINAVYRRTGSLWEGRFKSSLVDSERRELVKLGLNPEDAKAIRYATRKGVPAGSERFRREIESALSHKINSCRRGHPKKGL